MASLGEASNCALGAAPCAGCAAGLACPEALALAVGATALLTCLLTLLCVWLLARRAGLWIPAARRRSPPKYFSIFDEILR
jgi:hypothetical protein